MLPSDVTNVWSAGLAQTSISASDRRSQSADIEPSASAQDGSFSQRIAQALLGDSVAVAIRKGLQAPLGGSSVLHPWTEGDNRLLRHHGWIYVPEALQATTIEHHHNNPLAGHFGVQKTLELISRHYYWPLPSEVKKILQNANSDEANEDITDNTQWPKGMRAKVEEYCEKCAVCQRSKAARHKPYRTFSPLPVPEYKWSEITMDFVISLPPS